MVELRPNSQKIDWDAKLGVYACYKTLYGYASIDDVANCLSIIPRELDTPVLKEIRNIVEEYGGTPEYPGEELDKIGDPIKLKNLVIGKDKSWGTHELLYTPEEQLLNVKSRIRWGMNDFPYHLISECNQKLEREGHPVSTETGRIVNRDGSQPCHVVPEVMFKMRELGRELEKEDWDEKEMASQIKGLSHQKWIEQNAWDLTDIELKDIDINDKLGFK